MHRILNRVSGKFVFKNQRFLSTPEYCFEWERKEQFIKEMIKTQQGVTQISES